jgi:hypothetical protein
MWGIESACILKEKEMEFFFECSGQGKLNLGFGCGQRTS